MFICYAIVCSVDATNAHVVGKGDEGERKVHHQKSLQKIGEEEKVFHFGVDGFGWRRYLFVNACEEVVRAFGNRSGHNDGDVLKYAHIPYQQNHPERE